MNNLSFKNILVNIILFSGIYFTIHFYQTYSVVKGSAPSLEGVLLKTDKVIVLAEISKPVLVHFWATWCAVCKFEHPSINRIAKDFSVISVASQSGSADQVLQFLEQNNISYPVLMDKQGDISKDWRISGFPTSFIIDKNN